MLREVKTMAKTDRSQLRRALDLLAAGDVPMVTTLDRLARSFGSIGGTRRAALVLEPWTVAAVVARISS